MTNNTVYLMSSEIVWSVGAVSTRCRGGHVVSLAKAGSKCKEKLEELSTKARSWAEVIKAVEARVKDASLDAKTSCDDQRARIKSGFQEGSLDI